MCLKSFTNVTLRLCVFSVKTAFCLALGWWVDVNPSQGVHLHCHAVLAPEFCTWAQRFLQGFPGGTSPSIIIPSLAVVLLQDQIYCTCWKTKLSLCSLADPSEWNEYEGMSRSDISRQVLCSMNSPLQRGKPAQTQACMCASIRVML